MHHREKFQKKKKKEKRIGFYRWFRNYSIAAYLSIHSYHFAKTETWSAAKDIRNDLRPLGKKEHDNRWCYANFAFLFSLFRSIAAAISNRAAMNLHFSYFSHTEDQNSSDRLYTWYEGRM